MVGFSPNGYGLTERMFNVQIENEVYFSQEITPFFAQKIQMDESERVNANAQQQQKEGAPGVPSGMNKPEIPALPSHLQAYSRMNADIKKADVSIKKMIEKIRNNQEQINSLKQFVRDPCDFLDNFVLEQNGLLTIMKRSDLNNIEKQNFKESALLAELLIDEAPTAKNQISHYLKKRSSLEMAEKEKARERKEEEKKMETELKIENEKN